MLVFHYRVPTSLLVHVHRNQHVHSHVFLQTMLVLHYGFPPSLLVHVHQNQHVVGKTICVSVRVHPCSAIAVSVRVICVRLVRLVCFRQSL